jgi:hypothetical protein
LQSSGQASLRRAFAVWLRDVLLLARLPEVRIDAVLDPNEVRNMLAEQVIEWIQEWKRQGLEEDHKKSLEKGRKEGESLKFGPLDAATQGRG